MSTPRDWYLFDADDPRRAEQVMQRLRLDDGTLVVEQGTFAGWDVVKSEPMFCTTELEDRLAEARARGLVVESDPLAVLIRLSARHLDLEATIQAIDDLDSPAGREALQIYADFLQAHGDARGTLASLQLRDLRDQPTREWLADHPAQLQEIDGGKAADAWLAEHREQIFGYLAELVRKPPVYERWRGGWLTDLEIAPSRSRPEPVPELAALLRLPVCACLRHLHAPQQEWPNRPDLRCRASLRTLSIFGRSEAELELGELPRLEELTLTGCPRSLAIEAPNLRWLRFVDTPPYEICSFLAAPLPTERLSVELGWIPLTSAHELRELLHHPAIGRLRELNLDVEEYPFDDVAIIPPVPPEWIDVILAAPLLRQLEVRSFSLAYWQEQAKRLVDGFASAPGRTWVAADLTNYSPSVPAPPPTHVAGVWQRLRGWFTRP